MVSAPISPSKVPAESTPAAAVDVNPLSVMAAMMCAVKPTLNPPPSTAESTMSQKTRSRLICAGVMPSRAGGGAAAALEVAIDPASLRPGPRMTKYSSGASANMIKA